VTPGLASGKENKCEVSLASGWQTLDLDIGIVLETCLGELHATFGIGAFEMSGCFVEELYLRASALLCFESAQRFATQVHAPDLSRPTRIRISRGDVLRDHIDGFPPRSATLFNEEIRLRIGHV